MQYKVMDKHTNKATGKQYHKIGEQISLTIEQAAAPLRNGMLKEVKSDPVKSESKNDKVKSSKVK